MLKTIASSIIWQPWQRSDPRYQRLDIFDRFLDGTFYDHLPYDFSQEEDGLKRYIPIYNRRPSAPFNMAAMVARVCSRKLFTGRNAPRLVHDNETVLNKIMRLTEEAGLEKLMPQVITWGSVGSVAVTFKLVADEKSGYARMRAQAHRAKWCHPVFDKFGDLARLRVAYTSAGYEFLAKGFTVDYKGKPIVPAQSYWSVIDYESQVEKTYYPIKESDYTPSNPRHESRLIAEEEVQHDLNFVPAQWFENLAGGYSPDGSCTFAGALPMNIEFDYTFSQIGRACRYNANPQIVVIGSMAGEFNKDKGAAQTMLRAPHIMLMMKGGMKTDGVEREKGDAKLLEMTGNGIKIALEFCDKLKKFMAEQIAAQRRNPDEQAGLITGKAAEMLDQDTIDLCQELRSSYGSTTYLGMVKRMAVLAIRKKHPIMQGVSESEVDGLGLNWPRMYTATPQEMQQMATGVAQLDEAKIIPRPTLADYITDHLDLPRISANQIPERNESLAKDNLDATVTPELPPAGGI